MKLMRSGSTDLIDRLRGGKDIAAAYQLGLLDLGDADDVGHGVIAPSSVDGTENPAESNPGDRNAESPPLHRQ